MTSLLRVGAREGLIDHKNETCRIYQFAVNRIFGLIPLFDSFCIIDLIYDLNSLITLLISTMMEIFIFCSANYAGVITVKIPININVFRVSLPLFEASGGGVI